MEGKDVLLMAGNRVILLSAVDISDELLSQLSWLSVLLRVLIYNVQHVGREIAK